MDGDGCGDVPEELETLLEDTFLLRDADAVARLFEDGSLAVTGEGAQQVRGRALGRVNAGGNIGLPGCGYLAVERRRASRRLERGSRQQVQPLRPVTGAH